ncbi:MAG TPA: hypothetical protein VNJ08_08980 [Bacteriovoracaceae bacterium]|nr:hypothetical protein [Bacteriovoracaceae bacterium]
MGWSKKIKSSIYASGTIVNLGLAIYIGLPSNMDAWWLSFVIISAVLNHFFTIEALSMLVVKSVKEQVTSTAKILFYLVFKTFFLASGFVCLLLFVPDKVLQGLMLYIFQLIILGLSIKNIGMLIKKGTEK